MDPKDDVLMVNGRNGYALNSLIWFIVWLPLVTFLHVIPAMAYRGGHLMEPDRVIASLTARLDLTEEQEVQIRPIIETQMEKQRQIFEKAKTQDRQGREALRNEMHAIKKDTEDKLGSILTEQQMEKYRKMQDEKRQKMRNRRSRRLN